MALSPMEALLHSAAANANLESLKNLIEDPINSKDENQKTALHKACESGHLSTADYLIRVPNIYFFDRRSLSIHKKSFLIYQAPYPLRHWYRYINPNEKSR